MQRSWFRLLRRLLLLLLRIRGGMVVLSGRFGRILGLTTWLGFLRSYTYSSVCLCGTEFLRVFILYATVLRILERRWVAKSRGVTGSCLRTINVMCSSSAPCPDHTPARYQHSHRRVFRTIEVARELTDGMLVEVGRQAAGCICKSTSIGHISRGTLMISRR